MKIISIRSWNVKIPWDMNPGASEIRDPGRREFVFVQVDTDEGITGWGEVTTYPGPVANRAVAAYIDQIGEWLQGDDPANIEALWNKIFRGMTYVGTRGATTAAISAMSRHDGTQRLSRQSRIRRRSRGFSRGNHQHPRRHHVSGKERR
jgi:galactonate dehydratase